MVMPFGVFINVLLLTLMVFSSQGRILLRKRERFRIHDDAFYNVVVGARVTAVLLVFSIILLLVLVLSVATASYVAVGLSC